MQLAFLYVKLLKQQNYDKDTKVQTIKKVGEVLPYSTIN